MITVYCTYRIDNDHQNSHHNKHTTDDWNLNNTIQLCRYCVHKALSYLKDKDREEDDKRNMSLYKHRYIVDNEVNKQSDTVNDGIILILN